MNSEKFTLIFPDSKDVILAPILFDVGDNKKEVHYFILIPNENQSYDVYKWNYFPPFEAKNGSKYGEEINKQLNEITFWNFGFDTLEDRNFWDNYVLLKEGDTYKYLKKDNSSN